MVALAVVAQDGEFMALVYPVKVLLGKEIMVVGLRAILVQLEVVVVQELLV
jgi:hypothetical protein